MEAATDIKGSYENKFAQYFAGAREDMIEKLPDNPAARILEIGCGFGGTGELALKHGKCSEYYGIEISETAATVAKDKITDVHIGNVENILLPWAEDYFDALIMSEVLEHLVDPWSVLRRLNPLLRGGAIVMASSPNIGQLRVILSLINGNWELTDAGVMDRTHLRWFTPNAYAELFRDTGYFVDEIQPVTPFSAKARILDAITAGRFKHIFMRQIFLTGHKLGTS